MRTILAVVPFMITSLALAQEPAFSGDVDGKEPFDRITLSISGGATITMGSFSKFDYDTQQWPLDLAGPAHDGVGGRAMFTYLFHKNVGMVFLFQTSRNGTEPMDTTDLFATPPSPGLGGGQVRTSYSHDQGYWFLNSLLAGVEGRLPMGGRVALAARAVVGVQHTNSPYAELQEDGYLWDVNNPNAGTYTQYTKQPVMQSWHLAYGGGIDLHARLTGRLGALLSFDYIAATPSFDGEWSYAYTAANSDGSTTKQAWTEQGSFEKGTALAVLQLGFSLTLP